MRFALPTASLVVAALVLSGCGTGHDAVNTSAAGQFRFVNATNKGNVIPKTQRKPAADLHGTLIGAGNYQLPQHRGHVVLINYWATWCAPCVIESPMLENVYLHIHNSGVDFVGVDVKDERQSANAFITDKHMTYPMIYDETAKTALELGVPTGGLPVTVLIDRAGRVAAVYVGEVFQPGIEAALTELAGEAA